MPLAASEAFERPRTRAWVKAQAEAALLQPDSEAAAAAAAVPRTRKGRARAARSAAKQSSAQPQREGASRSARPVVQKAKAKQPPKSKPAVQTRAKQQSGSRARPTGREIRQKKAAQPNALSESLGTAVEVPTWLQQVRSVSPERALEEESVYTARVPGAIPLSSESMASTPVSRERTKENDDESTTKMTMTRSNKNNEDKLRYRRVRRKATNDQRLPHLRSILREALPVPSLEIISELRDVTQEFLEQISEEPAQSHYTFMDEFSHKFDEKKARMNHPIINPRYFQAQLTKCLAENEAALQRTVMMSVFHHYWLDEIFDWKAEGKWSQPLDVRLPSSEDDEIPSPKPDLAISFTRQSFTGNEDDSDPIPQELERCISPGGGDKCFPFLIMEVKRAAADLGDAYLANLHSASQALYNMYLWMHRADRLETFFQQVRIFSFVFNAQDLNVRVHRCSPLNDGNISFHFDDFTALTKYNRDQVCLLVDTILNDYAATELHGLLLAAYRDVVIQEKERVLSKRRTNAARNSNSKRQRRSGEVSQNVNQSFGMSRLQT